MTGLSRRLAGSALAGAASGARSFTGVAALTLATRPGAPGQPDRFLGRPWIKAAAGVLAAQEYVLDKLPNTPSRLAPPGLAGLAGAAASAVIIARREPGAPATSAEMASCAVAGLGAAVATAWLGLQWRTWAKARFGQDWIGAGVEDAATLTLAATAVFTQEAATPEGADMPRGQIKDEKTYQALRREGNSEEKSARIANAAAGSSRSSVGSKGGRSGSYEDWSRQDLLDRARELGISGRSSMTKSELIKALRNH